LPRPLAETVDDLVESFELFDDWEERYQYIIELGDELPPMDSEDRVYENKVDGCMSTVWLVARSAGEPPVIELSADSDSSLVKGLIAVLLRVYSGRSPHEILNFDVERLFDRLDLKQHLSRSRTNGLRSMIRRIRELAGRSTSQIRGAGDKIDAEK
jgi:cysteine desulfuration protein SufE